MYPSAASGGMMYSSESESCESEETGLYPAVEEEGRGSQSCDN